MGRPTLRRIAFGSSVEHRGYRTTLLAASVSAESDSGYLVVHDQPSDLLQRSNEAQINKGQSLCRPFFPIVGR